MNNIIDSIDKYIIRLTTAINKIDKEALSDVINVLLSTAEKGRVVYLLGNGGSASTASHMQNDFNCGLAKLPNTKFNFYSLADNIATITALANDIDYQDIFKLQLENKLKPGDLVLAISGSGNSKNILNAIDYAKTMGNYVIAMTGYDGGKLYGIADLNLHIPINDMQVTEDIHLIFNHVIVRAIKDYYCDIS